MNTSDFKLHGISPIYDQVIFVRCHICHLIIKLPLLVEHLQKRHKITNDSNDETISELIINEQRLSNALNEERSLAGGKNGKKVRAKQNSITNESNNTDSSSKLVPKVRKTSKSNSKSKNDKNSSNNNNNHELKKNAPALVPNASLPLLSSILDESLSGLKTSMDSLINCPVTDSSSQQLETPKNFTNKQSVPCDKNNPTTEPLNEQVSELGNADSSQNQIRFKYVVDKIKTKLNGQTTVAASTKESTEIDNPSNHSLTTPTKLDVNNLRLSEINNASINQISDHTNSQEIMNSIDGNPVLINNHNGKKSKSTKQNKEEKTPRTQDLLLNQSVVPNSSFPHNNHNMLNSVTDTAPITPGYFNQCTKTPINAQYKTSNQQFDPQLIQQNESRFEANFMTIENKTSSIKNENHMNNSINGTNNTNKINTSNSSSTKTIKIYDPNKHCGVVVEEIDSSNGTKLIREPCTRSLTCKKHSINLRRQVSGRCKSFNELFKEYRDEKLSTNQILNTNKSNNDISMLVNAPQASSTIPHSTLKNGTNCMSTSQKLSNSSMAFSHLPTHQPSKNSNTELSNTNSTRMDSNLAELADFNIQLPINNDNLNHHNNYHNPLTNNNNNNPNPGANMLMNEFDFMNYQNIGSTSQQRNPNQDYFFGNGISMQQQQQQYLTQNSKIIPDQYQFPQMYKQPPVPVPENNIDNQSLFKPYTHSPQNHPNSHKNLNFLSSALPSTVNNNSTPNRPLNFNEISQHLNLNYLNKMLVKHHPRPSAVTSYNARLTDNGGGFTLWDRKQDDLRLLLSNAFSQTDNYLKKNMSFTSSNGSDSSAQSNVSNIPSKSNIKYETNQDSFSKNLNRQDNKQKRSQTKSCYKSDMTTDKNELESRDSNFQLNQKQSPKVKSNLNTKKRNIPGSVDAQNHQNFPRHSNNNSNNELMHHAIDPLSNYLPAKLAKPNNDTTLTSTNDFHSKMVNKKSLTDVSDNFLTSKNYSSASVRPSDSIENNMSFGSRHYVENQRQQYQSISNRFVKEDFISLNDNTQNGNELIENYKRNAHNTIINYPVVNKETSNMPNQQHTHKYINSKEQSKRLVEDDESHFSNIKITSPRFSLKNQNNQHTSDLFHRASQFVKSSTSNDNQHIANSDPSMLDSNNIQSRKALKSISLSPSPSSSSSASNSSSITNNTTNTNGISLFNTIN